MRNLYSLFLSQAYQDCWDDYNRSLKVRNFPKWDYVILTASNEQQAEGFRKQIEERRNGTSDDDVRTQLKMLQHFLEGPHVGNSTNMSGN